MDYFKCFYCGKDLIWDSDYDMEDMCGDGYRNGISSCYHCPNCGRSYEICDPSDEEKENEYKNYWNDGH